MNITEEMGATDASKGLYVIGAKFRQCWLDAELHSKKEEAFDSNLPGSVEDMLVILLRLSRDHLLFIDEDVTDLRTYLEEEADLDAEVSGELRNVILTSSLGSDDILVAVSGYHSPSLRVLALDAAARNRL
eukprot:1185557-Pleurochrysis_carterae.AAC.2